MKLIFWGLLIAWLHSGGHIFFGSWLAVAGGYLFWRGLRSLPLCPARDFAERSAASMLVLGAAAFCASFFGTAVLESVLFYLMPFVDLYTLWLLIKVIAEVEQIVSHRMPISALKVIWTTYLICMIAIYTASPLMPYCSLIALGCQITFLYWLWQCVRAYKEAMAHPIEILPPEE